MRATALTRPARASHICIFAINHVGLPNADAVRRLDGGASAGCSYVLPLPISGDVVRTSTCSKSPKSPEERRRESEGELYLLA